MKSSHMLAAIAAVTVLGLGSAANAENISNFRSNQVELRIVNQSAYTIRSIYISPVSSSDWGRDVLGNSVLRTASEVKHYRAPGNYDVKLVDQDGDACTLKVPLFYNRTLNIWTSDLLACEAAG